MRFFSFGKRERSPQLQPIIAPGLLTRLPEIGRQTFSSPPQYVDVSGFYLPGFQAAGNPIEGAEWSQFVDQLVAELHQSAMNNGGWAFAGAFHVAKDFVKSEDWAKPNLVSLMDDALRFLGSQGVDGAVIPSFALQRFQELRNPK